MRGREPACVRACVPECVHACARTRACVCACAPANGIPSPGAVPARQGSPSGTSRLLYKQCSGYSRRTLPTAGCAAGIVKLDVATGAVVTHTFRCVAAARRRLLAAVPQACVCFHGEISCALYGYGWQNGANSRVEYQHRSTQRAWGVCSLSDNIYAPGPCLGGEVPLSPPGAMRHPFEFCARWQLVVVLRSGRVCAARGRRRRG